MAVSQEQVEKLHKVVIKPIDDATSRFSYKMGCSCGVQGHFFTIEDAEQYKQLHLNRKRMFPY